MKQGISRALRIPAVMGLLIVGAVALQVSCSHGGSGGTATSCGISPGSRSVTIGLSGSSLGADPDTLKGCPGDPIRWSRVSGTDTNTYTVQFNSSTADACGWGGVSQTIPVTCNIPASSTPTGQPGDKYSVTCSGAGCNGAPPLDPHVIIM